MQNIALIPCMQEPRYVLRFNKSEQMRTLKPFRSRKKTLVRTEKKVIDQSLQTSYDEKKVIKIVAMQLSKTNKLSVLISVFL